MHEIDDKVDRLARLAVSRGLGGILLNTQPNFAWLSGGRSNQIDGSRETGSGNLLVSARGERYVVANNIEMPRLQEEALAGLAFAPSEYAWTHEQADPGTAIATARRVVGGDIGCDAPLAGGTLIDTVIAGTRALLTLEEVDRYRALGHDLGSTIGEVCRTLAPGLTEIDIARRTGAAVACIGARAIVNLVAADDRMARYRHPAPTAKPWRKQVLIVVCAQRHGLVAALSRIVADGAVPGDLERRTAATASVFAGLTGATRPGACGADLFCAAAKAYAAAGFPGEETRHHQGGATGYRSREWIAHPESRETVQARQAFAWNPSVTGTKVEETVLVTEQGFEVMTTSPGWPSIPIQLNGTRLSAPGILTI
ncbi:MAG TPA: M24 family metallopeptidase [Vicinamibacterales bacterium]|nr:M24 family metallopeptidase [Vicinamibacterales bacterium]